MKRVWSRTVIALVVFCCVMYGVDWGVWRLRVAHGGGMGSVNVSLFQVAELKGGKEEYYPDGEGPMSCSETLFPHGGAKPCWYLTKHPVIFER